jgi:uncharacterized DUF497 family protein
MEFEWDPKKALRNLRKHKASFHEAATIFADGLRFPIPIIPSTNTDTSLSAGQVSGGCSWSLMPTTAM